MPIDFSSRFPNLHHCIATAIGIVLKRRAVDFSTRYAEGVRARLKLSVPHSPLFDKCGLVILKENVIPETIVGVFNGAYPSSRLAF